MMSRRTLLPFLLAAVAAPIHAAPISFNTALPVHEDGLLLREQGVWMRMHDDPSPMNRQMDVVALPLVLVYGATSKLALMGVFPYVDKRLNIRATGALRKASGLGDIMTVGRYEVFARSHQGETMRGALFGGLKWPTGRSRESDALGKLPPPVQVGSGSYDPVAGTVWTAQGLSAELDADLFFQRNTWANDFKFGDILAQDISLQYRLWPGILEGQGVPSYLYGVLEANNIYQAKNIVGGIKDDDSGGYQLFLTPGIQWVTKRAVFEVAGQIPAIQSMNGNALKSDFSLIGSVRMWF